MGYVTDGKTDTAAAAAESIQDQLAKLEAMVYRQIAVAGPAGATCFEVERDLDMIHQTVSARITGLQVRRLIKDSTMRRLTPSGRQAIVWVVRSKDSKPPLIEPDADAA